MSAATTTRRGAAAAAGALTTALWTAGARAADLLGQPTPGGIGMQPAASELGRSATWFHDWILLPIIIAICIFVLGLLLWVAFRFNAKANPVPARFSHNTTIEIAWTVAPVLILMFIAIFSFRLLYTYHDMPKPDVTVKATGNQWYWTYEYPESGGFAYDSIPLKQAQAEAKGPGLYGYAVDNPMVVPVGKTVQILTTGADVIHAFFIPAFRVQVDSVPGRINQTWFKAEKEGVYYGQCNELCGTNHSFMPIEVDVVSPAKYQAWLDGHAKKTPAPAAAAAGGASPAPAAVAGQAAPPAGAATGPGAGTGIAATVGPTSAAPPSTPVAAAPAPAAQTGPLGKAGQAPAPAKPAAANAASPASR